MDTGTLIVIGASAGGFNVLKRLVADLPPDFPAALFIVWHMSSDARGVLPQVLSSIGTLPAAHPVDGEPIHMSRIYVAPPDHHLLLEPGHVRVTKGPKEHRFRPAIDPLFRSAAYAYGSRVVGVVLSGGLDDGTSGLWTIKQRGGVAVVQDPRDAEVPSMPESAIREVAVDHVVPSTELASLLVRLATAPATQTPEVAMDENEKTRIEIQIAAQNNALHAGVMKLGAFTPYTCPDCHGALLTLKEGTHLRFRCHTGHAFSADSLLAAISEMIEDQLWNAIRSIEESEILLTHLGDHLADTNQAGLAALYYQKAQEATARVEFVRQAVTQHEYVSADRLQQQLQEIDVNHGTDHGHSI